MTAPRKAAAFILTTAILTGLFFCDAVPLCAQAQEPLTYPEVITALQTKLPNPSLPFRNKSELIAWVIAQIKRRKIDKPLTADREDDLRQAGATEQLIQTIRLNSPALPAPTPTPEPEPVDLGDLLGRAVNLVKPDYTPEAKRARTAGEVRLAVELDEMGRVTSVEKVTTLANGLTENAIEAARRSTFQPAMRNGKPARGKGILKYNFRVNLIDVPATLAAANDFRGRRDCDRAVPEYNRILEFDPKHAKALLGRGACHLIEANYNLAAADFSNGTASDPRDADLLFFLALALDFKGETAAAAENYEKALQLRPELDSQPTFDCLYIDRRSITPEQARAAANSIIGACNQALRGASPEITVMAYYKRGIAYRLKGDFDKAIAEFEVLRGSNPQFGAVNMQLQIAYNLRGLEAFNKKDYKKAFDDVSAAIRAEPQSPTPYINRCAIYLYAWRQYPEAINDCTTAIKLSTRSATAYNHRGYAYEMTNSRDQAIADYKKAIELDPRNQAARNNLNRIQAQSPGVKY